MRVLPPRSGERGLALLLVLLLSLILLPFAVEFAYQVDLESRTALNVTDQLKIENAIDGQFEIMLARLRYDAAENEVDIDTDSWNADEVLQRQEESVGVALGTTIFDEQSKLNLRTLAEGPQERRALMRARLARLLVEFRKESPFDIGESEANDWAAKIHEFVNKGPVRANVPTPRMADDRSILVLEELQVLGEVGGRDALFLLHDQRKNDDVAHGLHRYVTTVGNGKLNLNTVSEIVLRAWFPRNPEVAEKIIARRDNPPEDEEGSPPPEDGGTDTIRNPFTDVNQVMEIEDMTPQLLQDNEVVLANDFDVQSSFFGMRIVGETQVTRRDEFFLVERVAGDGEDEAVEGFRILLRQERVDPLERTAEEEEEAEAQADRAR
jgi:type II secretory pathway component PulK